MPSDGCRIPAANNRQVALDEPEQHRLPGQRAGHVRAVAKIAPDRDGMIVCGGRSLHVRRIALHPQHLGVGKRRLCLNLAAVGVTGSVRQRDRRDHLRRSSLRWVRHGERDRSRFRAEDPEGDRRMNPGRVRSRVGRTSLAGFRRADRARRLLEHGSYAFAVPSRQRNAPRAARHKRERRRRIGLQRERLSARRRFAAPSPPRLRHPMQWPGWPESRSDKKGPTSLPQSRQSGDYRPRSGPASARDAYSALPAALCRELRAAKKNGTDSGFLPHTSRAAIFERCFLRSRVTSKRVSP